MPDLNVWELDLMWLKWKAERDGKDVSDKNVQDAFCEKVAWATADGKPEAEARKMVYEDLGL